MSRSLSPWSGRRLPSTDIWNQFEEFFNDFDRGVNTRALAEFTPTVDIEEKENAYLISADIPGFKKEDIKIDMADNVLTISGERVKEVSEKKYSERSYGKFQRSFSLPHQVAADKIEAKYQDGVLHLTLPKAEGSRSRTIKVQ